MKLKLGWIRILTSGTTIDDREISADLIAELANTYNPETYNARINFEHERRGYKLGSVLELKAEQQEINGSQVMALMAMIEPNAYMISLVRSGQKVHTSCEIKMNFAKTGKPYLVGLALTDEPASLGTSELKLSAETETEVFSTNEEIESDGFEGAEKPGFLKKLFSKNENKDELMNQAILDTLNQLLSENQKMTEAVQKLTNQDTEKESENLSDNAAEKDPSANTESQTIAEFTAKLNEFASTIEASSNAVADLVTKLSEQTDEPQRQPANGSNGSQDDEVL